MTAAAPPPPSPLRRSCNGSNSNNSVILRSSPSRNNNNSGGVGLMTTTSSSAPNNSSSITNYTTKKIKTTALLIKYVFLAILILLVYFLLRINLQLIQRLESHKKHAAAAAVVAVTAKEGDKTPSLRASSSLVVQEGGNNHQQEEQEEEQAEKIILQNRLITLRSEVATMQQKVNDMQKRIDHIKDIQRSSSGAEIIAAAGGVKLSTKTNNNNKNEELIRHTCTPTQTTLQTMRLQKRFSEWWSHSACPDQLWMDDIHDLFATTTTTTVTSSSSQPFLILDIGCNKGYTSADFFDALTPGTNINPSTLVTAIRSIANEDNTKIDREGGVCNDSKKMLNVDRTSERDVEIHCFEPSPATYEMLKRVHEKLLPTNEEEGTKEGGGGAKWFIHNKGLHKVNGEMAWHSACAHAVGDELCTIVKEGTENAIIVPVVTVDKFLEETYPSSSSLSTTLDSSSTTSLLPLVHMLKIDAEGLDPAVLEGSRNLLTQNRAIMVMFEFNPGLSEKGDHPHGMWGKKGNPHVTLLQVTDWLDQLGYDCYLDTHLPDENEMKKGVLEAPGLYRITGDCFSKEPSVRGWANVVCASRKYGIVAKRLLELATIVTT